MDYKKSTLGNGIRVLTSEMPQMKSVATTVYIGAGARYEDEKNNGISHFLEHMVFKGTDKWPDQAQIARSIEGIGGQLNAWTDYEYTAYWNQVPAESHERALEVLADMVIKPLIETTAIDRERGVIIEEIHRTADFPSTDILDKLMGVMWPGQPLGRSILGTQDNIIKMSKEDFESYKDESYASNAIVISVAGNVKHEEVMKLAEKYFAGYQSKKAIKPIGAKDEQSEPKSVIWKKDTDQIHLALGIRGLSYSDKERVPEMVMNTILGRGMSSRLFLNIREDKGLAYSIYSSSDSATDTGILYIHAGLNKLKLDAAIEAILTELQKLSTEPVGEVELAEAKKFITGSVTLSMDDTDYVSSWYGKQELLVPEVLSPEELIRRVEKVTSEDIMDISKRLFQTDQMNIAMIGPLENGEKYKKLIKL